MREVAQYTGMTGLPLAEKKVELHQCILSLKIPLLQHPAKYTWVNKVLWQHGYMIHSYGVISSC